MLNIYYAGESCDKERFLFDHIDPDVETIIIVPDQASLQMERDALDYFRGKDGRTALLDLMVADFSSLGYKVIKEAGGRQPELIDKYGRQMLLALAQAGAKVINASRNIEKNEQGAAELRKQGYDVSCELLDQGDPESIDAFMEKVEKAYGRIDVFVNNAVWRGMKHDEDWEGFTTSLRINGVGMSHLTTKIAKRMVENGGGSIINIGSYMGILGGNEHLYRDTEMTQLEVYPPDYWFHKGGITNYTRFMASKFGPRGVRVNCLALGGLYSGQPEIFVKRYGEDTFLKRMGCETDVMGVLVWLASEASAYVTGTVIPIDGGYSAR